MFPRRSAVTKVLVISFTLCVFMWVWISSPDDLQKLTDVKDRSVAWLIREQSVPSEHNHVNQTLELLKKNMTVLKANQSQLQDIIHHVNGTPSNVTKSGRNWPNPHPFNYILNTENICADKDVFLIVYVHTAPDHHKRRMVIRQTWGNQKFFPNNTIRVVFVMGRSSNVTKTSQTALTFENEEYHDIVQEDFLDTYKNLTYKGIAGLRWVSKYCPHAKFTLKSDDDIFVNMYTLLRHLTSYDKLQINNKNLIMCLVWYRMKVMRTGKWKVGTEDFKDDYYPTYCSGSAFTMSTDVAIAMHNISYEVPFFWVDDFYITGLLPLKLGLKHKQFMSTYVLDGRKLEDKFTGNQWFTYIFSHVHDLNAIQSVWDRLVKLSKGVQVPPVKYALPGQLPNEEEIRRLEAEKEKAKAEEKKKKAEKA